MLNILFNSCSETIRLNFPAKVRNYPYSHKPYFLAGHLSASSIFAIKTLFSLSRNAVRSPFVRFLIFSAKFYLAARYEQAH